MAEHYCEEHDTVWFKKGKMKGYAHPMGEGEKWCYEKPYDMSAPQKPGTYDNPEPPQPEQSRAQPQEKETMSKAEWREKDRIARESFHRQKALEEAVLLVNGGKVELRAVISCAGRFMDWLEGKPIRADVQSVTNMVARNSARKEANPESGVEV